MVVIHMVKRAVEGHLVLVDGDAGEAAVLKKPPVTVAPARHARHDDLALERAPERDGVDDQPPLEGIE